MAQERTGKGIWNSSKWNWMFRERPKRDLKPMLRSRIKLKGRIGTDPHKSDKLNPDPHQSDQDPHQFADDDQKFMEYEPI
jgi:hypothetical protein